MRILILSQYFTPEIGATSTRVHTLARELARRGHMVDVICEVPNHPQGIVHEGFRNRLLVRRRLDGFRALYVWVVTRPAKTAASRMAFYGSYAGLAAIVGVALPRPDVVFASSPPLPVGAAAALVAARHRTPWILDVRDLWPEAAVALGELTSNRIIRMATILERTLYRSASAITTVTEPFVEAIVKAGGDRSKITLLPNGTTRAWVDGARLEPSRGSLGLPSDRFIWTFAGNVGLAQGLETALRAAARLGDGYQLLILGDGAARPGLERQAAALSLRDEVRFVDQVPPESAIRYARASDALLVSLAPDPALAAFVPSKLFDFCAVGRPVVVAAKGETPRLTADSGAALPVPPGDPEALAEAIAALRSDAALRERLASAGRAFGAARAREDIVDKADSILTDVARRAPMPR
jgi:colanic acid biosynthesis glycosyl transferase WcaI